MAFKKLSVFNSIMLWITVAAALAMVGSFLSSYISPGLFWPLWFLSASFPLLTGVVIALQLYWLIVLRWPVLIPLLSLAVCYIQISRLVQFRLPVEEVKTENTIKILSYNVHLFDWYNWRNPWTKRKQIIEQVRSTKADILCFQEFFHNPKEGFITLDSLISQNGLNHFYFEKYNLKRKFTGYGMLILSRWPIINKGKFNFENTRGNSAIFADILINNDTIRVYNFHLESNRFRPEDYSFMHDVNDGNTEIENSKGWKGIVKRLKISATARSSQADTLALHIASCPYPVLVCGDLNDSPSSYAYNRISASLLDAFMQKGSGIGQTYIGKAPSFRIDYLLHSKSFNTNTFETHPEDLSDHHAVSANLEYTSKW